ncbi:putative LRR receptor-like serine/threonine-protein kinase [Sesamum alatum]|uniref:LRR receptor-like serine/threonine-protein kinase n=1 Tax=Sesamum alatum TaxID=300844 RepID=A0AAE1YB05_9LAMI|nr:putative LRR receptor-like serine/threonine-protein kinase [Sesamum alatum]
MVQDYSVMHLLLKLSISVVLLLLLPLSCFASNKPDVEGDVLIEFLAALNDSNHKITDWDNHFVSPCFSWSNVTCRNGRVVSLSLASYGFTGTLSPSISKLKYLVTLDLQNNNLSGPLPDSLGDMLNLQNLNLAHNNFNGTIPESWGRIPNLKHLVMRGNHLSGSIPESLANVTDLMELDLSSNDLTGEIPRQLFSTPTFNFTATHLTCGNNLQQPCVSSSSVPGSKGKSKVQVAVTAASICAFSLLLLGAFFGYRFHRVRKLKHDIFVDVAGEDERKISFGQIRRFSLREMQLATDNFSESNIIGQGGYGKVYRGVLVDNTRVAVKRLMDYHSPGGEAAFLREVHLISVAVHKNLLRLIGFCTTSTERILVYPFMQNLSVAYRLRDFSRLEEEEDVLLLDHIKKLLREKRLEDIVDRNLKSYNCKEVETILQVAMLCTQSSPEDRPRMAEVVSMLQGVGLAERWAEWEQLEEASIHEFSLMSHKFIWAEDSTHDQEAIQLSQAR